MKNRIRSFLGVLVVLLCAVTAQAKTASEVFEAVSPSVVVMKTFDAKGKALGLGSGVVLADGLIVTNCHVIKGAASMKVDSQGTEYAATPRQTDWDRDVCTLAVAGLHAKPAVLGTTNRLKVGQQVYAVGAPKGLELTMSDGIISSLRPVQGGQYLQITAPISPGSSGGGLFDDEGRLIGLPTFYLTEGQQLNFAVPVEWINELPKRQTTVTEQKNADPKASQTTTTGWLNKAMILWEKNDWQRLQDHALRWTKAVPGDSDAWVILGVSYSAGAKQHDKAIEAYQQAIRLNPEHFDAWLRLGGNFFLTKQTYKAIEAYQQAIRLNPENAEVWIGLGDAYDRIKQFDKAIEANQQAIRINPDLAYAWNNLGYEHYMLSQYAKAIEFYQQALRIDSNYADSWFTLGLIYVEINQNAKAIEALQQAVRIKPDDAKALYWLGAAYKKSGQTGRVMDVYKRLKTLDPDKTDEFFNKYVMP